MLRVVIWRGFVARDFSQPLRPVSNSRAFVSTPWRITRLRHLLLVPCSWNSASLPYMVYTTLSSMGTMCLRTGQIPLAHQTSNTNVTHVSNTFALILVLLWRLSSRLLFS